LVVAKLPKAIRAGDEVFHAAMPSTVEAQKSGSSAIFVAEKE
jgi:hypothetical protein